MSFAARRLLLLGSTSSGGGVALPENLAISGTPEMAELLTLTYDNPEDSDTIEWYRADDTNGTNEALIDAADYSIYWPGSADIGKYLRAKVTRSGGASGYSAYTSVVTSSIVLEDDFNYGHLQSFDTSKWTVTNPSDVVAITQKAGKAEFVSTSGTVALFVNKLESVATITSGALSCSMFTSATTAHAICMGLVWDSSNLIRVAKTGASANARLVVTVAGSSPYAVDVAVSFSRRWKIRYDANGDIYFYYYDGATETWVQATGGVVGEPNYSNVFSGSAKAVLSLSAITGASMTLTFDDLYLCSADHSLNFPHRFNPPTAANEITGLFQSLRLGGFFHHPYYLAYTVPEGDTGGDWSDARTWAKNFDWETFASQLTNIDYVMFQAKVELGFRNFDAGNVDLYNQGNTHSLDDGPITVPQWGFNYSLGNSSLVGIDTNELQHAIDAFKDSMPCGIYYSLGKDLGYRNTLTGDSGSAADQAWRFEYAALVERDLEYLIETLSGLKILWLDWAAPEEWPGDNNDVIRLYNKLKRKKPTLIIISNFPANGGSFYTSGSLKYFPTDVLTVEWQKLPSPTSDFSNEESAYNGTTYFIPREMAYSPLFRDASVQWPWLEDAYWAGLGVNQIHTQSEIQDQYDIARGYNAPLAINIPIKHDGTLDATYLSRVNAINK